MASKFKVIRSKRKTLSLHVLPDLSIEVKAPFFIPNWEIHKFIEKNSAWIEKRRNLLTKQRIISKTYQQGEKLLYLGNEYVLEIGNYSEIKVEKNTLLFPEGILFRAKKEIEFWYIKQAREVITYQVEKFANEMNTSYKKLAFSDTKSQWGSCSHDNRLQFSWKLIMTPLLVINYVVIHELAHTIEKNHSAYFWDIVRKHMPSYKQQIKWLKLHGNSLIV